MVRVDESEAATGDPILVHLKDVWVKCQVFVGSRVAYNDAVYIVGEIYQKEQNGRMENAFALWPIPPNEGDVVMDVTDLLWLN